jgi:hypothetical protein
MVSIAYGNITPFYSLFVQQKGFILAETLIAGIYANQFAAVVFNNCVLCGVLSDQRLQVRCADRTLCGALRLPAATMCCLHAFCVVKTHLDFLLAPCPNHGNPLCRKCSKNILFWRSNFPGRCLCA